MRGSVLSFESNGSHPVAGMMYRTKICKFGKTCQYGDRCFYAHSTNEIRQRSESNVSCLSVKLSDSMHRPSRRSSTILSEINHDPSNFTSISLEGLSRRNSQCTENDANLSNISSFANSCRGVCALGTELPAKANIPGASVFKSEESPESPGSLSPISVVSTRAASIVTGSYYYYYIKFMQSNITPSALSKLLQDAAPEFYIE
jgi:hypothetical protein